MELEGVVKAVDPNAHTLTISADDSEQSGALITVTLPSIFNPSAYTVGGEVELVVTINPDGTYTAVGSSEDGSDSEADSASDDQGDLSSDDQGETSSGDQGETSSGDQGEASSGV
ncbi:MAG: hypothetical protein NVSMB25_18700 [Thermoleophilaceae bacterium]